MKKFLFIYALCATALAAWGLRFVAETRRLENNQTALCEEIARYRTELDEEAASVRALRLRCEEYRKLRGEDARRIRELGIRIRRLESTALTATETRTELQTIIRDTVIRHDTLRVFHWSDRWVRVDGRILRDSVECSVESRDTLRQIVHRIPRRFLFIRYDTKGIRQEIICSNPHTKIAYSEYIELERRGKRKK